MRPGFQEPQVNEGYMDRLEVKVDLVWGSLYDNGYKEKYQSISSVTWRELSL
jgi:hypothetical protein